MLIYKATFPNQKSYIGKANNIKRLKDHKYEAYNPKHRIYNTIFNRAIRKYDWKNVVWEILEDNITDETILNERETFNILKYDTFMPNGYNMTSGGEGTLGRVCSEESNKKRRKAMIGHIVTNKTKELISKSLSGKNHPNFGKKFKEETCHKISISLMGKQVSKETREKFRLNNIGKKQSKETIEKRVNSRRWYKPTKETKNKMREARLRYFNRLRSINNNKEEL